MKSSSHLPDDYLRAIGNVTASWSALEVMMEFAIIGVQEINADTGLVLTGNISVNDRISLLYIYRDGLPKNDPRRRLKGILNRIEKAQKKRNEIVHSFWTLRETDRLPRRMSVRTKGKKLKVENEPTPLDYIESAAAQIYRVGEDFKDYMDEFGLSPDE